MAALTFDKNELGNLEYSLQREMLATNRLGGYMSTTIVCCNTRKYHGLIVSPIDDSERDFVLLSSLDETIIRDGQRFNLALHRYKGGVYEPRGHKYITDFEYTPCPTITYRVGDVILRKEFLWIHKRTQLMVRYTLVEGGHNKPVTLQLRPFLAFRDRHELSKANMYADWHSYDAVNGVKCRLYDNFPYLYMQTNRAEAEYVPAPDWYNDFEYTKELEDWREGHEDLLTPGYFEVDLKFGESIIFSASTEEMFSGETIDSIYNESVELRTNKVDFKSCLEHSGRQFIAHRANGNVDLVAGYPWFEVVGRDTFVSLPGLTLAQGRRQDCLDVLNSVAKEYAGGNLRYTFTPEAGADGPLWAFRALQMLEKDGVSREEIWKSYSPMMKSILDSYMHNQSGKISVHDNGLVWAWSEDSAISWLDYTYEVDQTQGRNGYQVEVNALWYNAVSYALDLAKEFGDSAFVDSWSVIPAKTKESFVEMFWLSSGYLADFVNNDVTNSTIRLNMIMACCLDYKMLNEEQQVDVIRVVGQHLLTPRGLRSLSPLNPMFGSMSRTQASSSTNGSVWVWPLLCFVKANFDIQGAAFVSRAESILEGFGEDIQAAGIGSISEYFEADPPHHPRGAISSASSVAAILEIMQLIDKYKAEVVAPKAKRVTKPRATKATAAKTKSTTTSKAAPKRRTTKKVEE